MTQSHRERIEALEAGYASDALQPVNERLLALEANAGITKAKPAVRIKAESRPLHFRTEQEYLAYMRGLQP